LDRSERLAEVGRLSAWVAHEVNNPLDGIREGIRILMRDPDSGPELLPHMDDGLQRIERVVKMLLAYTHKPILNLGLVRPDDLVRESLRDVAHRVRAKPVALDADVPPSARPIRGDRIALRQVLVNLLQNAVDAVAEGGSVNVRVREEGGSIHLAVSDDARGFRPTCFRGSESRFSPPSPWGRALGWVSKYAGT